MSSDATYDVFLSHADKDKSAVEELARRLRSVGIEPFLDKWHLVPGEPWQEALEEALDRSRTCAVFLGSGHLGPWQNEELRDALDTRVRDKSHRVVPVLLPGASMPEKKALPPFLRRLTWVEFRSELNDPQAFHRLVCGIKGIPPGDVPAGPELPSPVRGSKSLQRKWFSRSRFLLLATTTLAAVIGILSPLLLIPYIGHWLARHTLSTGLPASPAVASALVRISGTRADALVQGSGFVVGLDGNKATIVTASHLIEGAQHLEVTFAADQARSFPVGAVLGMDAGSLNGLAAFQVRGALPERVTTLSFEVESRPHPGESLFLLGFPEMELAPRTIQRVLSGRSGTLLLVDQEIGEGFSGGPVLQASKVVGVVTGTDGQTTYAVNALVASEAMEGWGVKLSGHSSTPETSTITPTKPAPPELEACVPGEESTEASIVFVRICQGTFTMGSAESDPQADGNEKPAHKVTLREFWIGKTEVTNAQYRHFRPDHQGEASLPVTEVSWTDAQAACERFGGRLPTEAEWEYAVRAGSQTAWSFGDDEKRIDEYAWYGERSGEKAHPVGTKKANAWGLYDMHGNVAEWVADWYGTYPSVTQTDPSGPETGESRTVRGGAFNYSPRDLRSAIRFGNQPSIQNWVIGFRCARSPRRHP